MQHFLFLLLITFVIGFSNAKEYSCDFFHLSSTECVIFQKAFGNESLVIVGAEETQVGPKLVITGETDVKHVHVEASINVTYDSSNKSASVIAAFFPTNPTEDLSVWFPAFNSLKAEIAGDFALVYSNTPSSWQPPNPSATATLPPLNVEAGLSVALTINGTETKAVQAVKSFFTDLPVFKDADELVQFSGLLVPQPTDLHLTVSADLNDLQVNANLQLKDLKLSLVCDYPQGTKTFADGSYDFKLVSDTIVSISESEVFDGALDATVTDGFDQLVAESENVWHIPVGSAGFDAKDLKFTLAHSTSTTISADLQGTLDFGDSVDATIKLDLPIPDESKGFEAEIDLSGSLQQFKTWRSLTPVLMGCPSSKPSIPSNKMFDQFADAPLDLSGTATLTFVSDPVPTFKLLSEITYNENDKANAELLVTQDDSKQWGAALGVAVGGSIPLSSVSSSLKDLDSLLSGDAAIVLSYFPSDQPVLQHFSDLSNDDDDITVPYGKCVAIHGKVSFNPNDSPRGLGKVVSHWFSLDGTVPDSIAVTGAVGENSDGKLMITLDGKVAGRFNIDPAKKVAFTGLELKLDFSALDLSFDLKLTGDMSVTYDSTHDPLELEGGILFAEKAASVYDVGGSFALKNSWDDVFGIKNLDVDHTELQFGINVETGIPTLFEFGTEVDFGAPVNQVSTSGTVIMDFQSASGNDVVAKATLSSFNLDSIAKFICGDCQIPQVLQKTVLNLSFENIVAYLNPMTHAVTFNQETFQPGSEFSVGKFDLFGLLSGEKCEVSFTGSIKDPENLNVQASIDPVDIADLHILELSGTEGAQSPFSFDLSLSKTTSSVVSASFDAMVKFLDSWLSAKGSVDDEGIKVTASYKLADAINLDVDFTSQGELPKINDFTMHAVMENDLTNWLDTEVSENLKDLVTNFNKELADAKAAVADWKKNQQIKIPGLDEEIQKVNQSIAKLSGELDQRFIKAEQDVTNAKTTVDGLQSEIDSLNKEIEHCDHWYSVSCHSHNAWVDTKVAAVETAKGTADLALEAAEAALKDVQAAFDAAGKTVLKEISDASEEIDALEKNKAVINAAGAVANAGLDAAQSLVDALADVAQWIIKEEGKAAKLVDVTYLSVDADSALGVKTTLKVDADVKAEVMEKPHEWHFNIVWPPTAESIEDDIMNLVKELFFPKKIKFYYQ